MTDLGSLASSGGASVIDVTDAQFDDEVITRSQTTPVVVDLWAPWCGPCTTLGPILEQVVGATNGRVILAKVNVDENPDDARRFLRRYEVPYPILQDNQGQWAAQYQLPGMPTAFIIDQNGTIRMRHSGFRPGDMAKIREQINSLLIKEES